MNLKQGREHRSISSIAASPDNNGCRKKVQRISTGSKNVDDLFWGGIETYAITELYGAAGTGKTQLCHILSVMVQQHQSVGGLNGKALYIDTDNTFRPERIVSIAQGRGFNTGSVLRNIRHAKAYTSHHQELLLQQATSIIEKDDAIKLLIIDSVIGNYRAEFLGRGNRLSQRQQKLYRFMYMLSRIGQSYGIAAVVTNQVNSGMPSPAGGNIMSCMSTYRVSLSYSGLNRIAKIVKSPYHRQINVLFKLSEKGVEDI
jgi:DNA repair protein RadA